jgi:IS30 family transposase
VPLGERGGSRGPIPAAPNYSALIAQQRFESRLARSKISKLAGNDRLREQVQARVNQHHSPEQISARLVIDFPRRSGAAVCPTKPSTDPYMCKAAVS